MSGQECWLHSRMRPPGGAAPAARGCGSLSARQAPPGHGNALGSRASQAKLAREKPSSSSCGEDGLGHSGSSHTPDILSCQRPEKPSSRVLGGCFCFCKWANEVRDLSTHSKPWAEPRMEPRSLDFHQRPFHFHHTELHDALCLLYRALLVSAQTWGGRRQGNGWQSFRF